jgi:hypothetical protein
MVTLTPPKIVLIILISCFLVGGVQANWALTLQQPEDFIAQIECNIWAYPGSYCRWTENATGGNSYMDVFYATYYINSPLQTQYIAYTNQNPGCGKGNGITLATASLVTIDSVSVHDVDTCFGDRVEITINSGTSRYYVNGVQVHTHSGLIQNPSYVLIVTPIDDLIYGSTDPFNVNASDHYIFGMPDQGYYTGKKYYLMKDILNPASSGFYRQNTTTPNGTPTLISSFFFPTTFSKGQGNNESVVLNEYGGGNYLTRYTGTKYSDVIQWDLTSFFASSAPYGLYVTTIPGTVRYSETIPYIGSGAYISFDKTEYGVGETGIVNVEVSPGYYDTATYNYKVVIRDIYGTEVSDQPITFTAASPHTGSVSYTWKNTDGNGVYYGLIYAVRKADSEELLMNYAYCELTSGFIINGYVKDAETTAGIPLASVNITQGATTDTITAGFNGNYTTTSDFVTGASTTITAAKTGYETYSHTFTPYYAGVIQINLTLMPNNVTYTGIALGGIARTPPYNRTIDNALIAIRNGSTTFIATTNSAGYYIKNSILPNNNWWDIWGSKTGYANSTIYQKLVVGI